MAIPPSSFGKQPHPASPRLFLLSTKFFAANFVSLRMDQPQQAERTDSLSREGCLFRIKICGVRSAEDVWAARRAGADAIGMNLFPGSLRFQDPKSEDARAIAAAAREAGVCVVGVFVGEPVDRLISVARSLGLDAVQLHGDESLETARQIQDGGWPVVRAVRLPTGPLDAETIERLVAPWFHLRATVLIDADAGAAYGGSGQRLDWQSLGRWASRSGGGGRPWVLAGGLTPETVGTAIRQAGPAGVDVASGTERPRGFKCTERVESFCSAAKAAWAAVDSSRRP